MDAFLASIVIAIVFGLVVSALRVTAPPPQVIYVRAEPPQRSGVGCMPLIVVGFVIFVVLLGLSRVWL